jgi:hypothetical protein
VAVKKVVAEVNAHRVNCAALQRRIKALGG